LIVHTGSLKSDDATTGRTVAAATTATVSDSNHHLTLFQFFNLQIRGQKQRLLLLLNDLLQPC
jgi:hypothetical protein